MLSFSLIIGKYRIQQIHSLEELIVISLYRANSDIPIQYKHQAEIL